jgi:two-component system sensor histidine kinase KdpD
LTVSDDGPGLPADLDPDRLFDKFQRGRTSDASDRHRAGGVGLGLAICRAIARSLGGEIRAERIPAGGAMFIVSLPLPDEAPDMPREEAA